MTLKITATDYEQTSPVFLQNQTFCKAFESFVQQQNGEIKGSYGAWAYLLHARFSGQPEWILRLERATYTSGNLLLSSKYQNVKVHSQLKASPIQVDCPDFSIERNTTASVFTSLFKKEQHSLREAPGYTFTGQQPEHPLVHKVVELLSEALAEQQVLAVHYKSPVLEITLHSQELETELLEELLQADFSI